MQSNAEFRNREGLERWNLNAQVENAFAFLGENNLLACPDKKYVLKGRWEKSK